MVVGENGAKHDEVKVRYSGEGEMRGGGGGV